MGFRVYGLGPVIGLLNWGSVGNIPGSCCIGLTWGLDSFVILS